MPGDTYPRASPLVKVKRSVRYPDRTGRESPPGVALTVIPSEPLHLAGHRPGPRRALHWHDAPAVAHLDAEHAQHGAGHAAQLRPERRVEFAFVTRSVQWADHTRRHPRPHSGDP